MALQFKNHGVLAKILKESGFTLDSVFPKVDCVSLYLMDIMFKKGQLVINSKDLLYYKITNVESCWLTQEFVRMLEESKFIEKIPKESTFSFVKFKLGPKLKDIFTKEMDYRITFLFPVITRDQLGDILFDYTRHIIECFNPPYTIEKHKLWYKFGMDGLKLQKE